MNLTTWQKGLELINTPFLHLGEVPITIGSLLTAVIVLGAFLILSFVLRHLIIKRLANRFGVNPAVAYSIRRVIHYTTMTVGVVCAIQAAGFSLSSLTVILGFLSVGIGFGLKNITSNFMSGVILLFERPITVGDMITIDNQSNSIAGVVRTIGMRSTIVKTFDNVNVIVPNSQFIEAQVINWSYGDPKIRLHVSVGVAYGSDTRKVTEVLMSVAANHSEVLKVPKPKVWFTEFDNSSLNFELLVWINAPEQRFNVRSELNYAIDDGFRKNDIQIPFPQRDVHIKMTPAIKQLSPKNN